MPRTLVVGNGEMLVNLDQRGMMHDFYFPYVGLEDHTTFGHYHRIGVFDEDKKEFSWLTGEDWISDSEYVGETLVGKTILKSEKFKLEIQFLDFVLPVENVMCRRITFRNKESKKRNLEIFLNFDFHLYGVKGNDTVYYNPDGDNIIFYKYNRYFLINAKSDRGGIYEYATGKSEFRGLEGTWRDAEDGRLSGNPIEQGSVDATFSVKTCPNSNDESVVNIWICAGKTFEEVKDLNKKVKSTTLKELLNSTTGYWKNWVNKQNLDFQDVPDEIEKLFKQSLLIIRTQIDNRGAIIAANDTDIVKFNKDTYSYMWPRDGAFVIKALDDTGYSEISKRFFRFCTKVQSKQGFFLHKFNPDGSIGSSWHPWIYKGKASVPLQEDETALIIYALKNHYDKVHDIEFIQEVYDSLVLKAANFMCHFIDPETDLPRESYDPWEEKMGIFTFTCSTVYRGLICAAELSEVVGFAKNAKRYRDTAERIRKSILKYLYDEEEKTFLKRIYRNENGKLIKDYQTDASISGIFLFDVLPPDDERVRNTMKRIWEKLEVKTEIGGLARYENDRYQAVSDSLYPPGVPGNPWIITTLWYAEWLLRIAKNEKSPEFKEAVEKILWVNKYALKSGILPEQINPFNGSHLSVAPLTWSHAIYIDTVLLYREKLKEFGISERCIIPKALKKKKSL